MLGDYRTVRYASLIEAGVTVISKRRCRIEKHLETLSVLFSPWSRSFALEGRGPRSGAMLAARSSGGGIGGPGGHQPPHVHRKHSVASLSGLKAQRSNSQDAKRNSSSGKQVAQHRNKAAVIREMETNWYLKMFGLGKDETVAQKTGMLYRSVKPCLSVCGHACQWVIVDTWECKQTDGLTCYTEQLVDEHKSFVRWIVHSPHKYFGTHTKTRKRLFYDYLHIVNTCKFVCATVRKFIKCVHAHC